jgi:bifunctional enzyme CysN/CysC
VDVRKGVVQQTRRHAVIAATLGIGDVVFVVNKMDLVGFEADRFTAVEDACNQVAADLGLRTSTIPICARDGDNLLSASARTPWHRGSALLPHLETTTAGLRATVGPLRFIAQSVNRPTSDFRGLMGSAAGGGTATGEDIVNARTGEKARVQRIVTGSGDQNSAATDEAVTLVLDRDIDVGRGDILARGDDLPAIVDEFAADLIWMSETPLVVGREYVMRLEAQTVPASITSIKSKVALDSLTSISAAKVETNDIAACRIATRMPVIVDLYAANRRTGGFVLMDRETAVTVGAGMVREVLQRRADIRHQALSVSPTARSALLRQKPAVL